MKKSLEISMETSMVDGVAGIRQALKIVPDHAKWRAVTSWVGYGPSERQEVTGIKFEWTEEL